MNKKKLLVLAVGLISTMALAHADTGPDLTPVTGGLSAMQVAVLASASAVIGGAMSLFAVKVGGRWLKGLWKTFSS